MRSEQGIMVLFVLLMIVLASFLLAQVYNTSLSATSNVQQASHYKRARSKVVSKLLRSSQLRGVGQRVGKAQVQLQLHTAKSTEELPILMLSSLFEQARTCPGEVFGEEEFLGTSFRSSFTCTDSFGGAVSGNLQAQQVSAELRNNAFVAALGYIALAQYEPLSQEVMLLAGGDLSIDSLVCVSEEQRIRLVSLSGSVVVRNISGCGVLGVSAVQDVYVLGGGYREIVPFESSLETFVLGLSPDPRVSWITG